MARRGRSRRGATVADVAVVLLLVALVGLTVLTALPRQREAARLAQCRRQLQQIGVAMVYYDQAQGHLPAASGAGPLDALRVGLGLDDFGGLSDPSAPPPKAIGAPMGPHRIGGFLCPSDRRATRAIFPAPTSYRGNAGSDVRGETGPFSLTGWRSLREVEEGDGLSHTAAFAERLVGDGREGVVGAWNYAQVGGGVGPEGCPGAPAGRWRGDAGSDWSSAGWVSGLYNHSSAPNGAPSCVAADGGTARMGASSGHAGGAHMLRADLSAGLVTPRVDASVWRAMGTVRAAP